MNVARCGDPILTLEHLDKMKIDPKSIDEAFISHHHDDHRRGIYWVFEKNPKMKVHFLDSCGIEAFKAADQVKMKPNQMVKALEKKGLILRHPGQPRSLQILVHEEEIPPWNSRKQHKQVAPAKDQPKRAKVVSAPPANLYVLSVFLTSGPISEKFPSKVI